MIIKETPKLTAANSVTFALHLHEHIERSKEAIITTFPLGIRHARTLRNRRTVQCGE